MRAKNFPILWLNLPDVYLDGLVEESEGGGGDDGHLDVAAGGRLPLELRGLESTLKVMIHRQIYICRNIQIYRQIYEQIEIYRQMDGSTQNCHFNSIIKKAAAVDLAVLVFLLVKKDSQMLELKVQHASQYILVSVHCNLLFCYILIFSEAKISFVGSLDH